MIVAHKQTSVSDGQVMDVGAIERDYTDAIVLELRDCYAILMETVHNALAASANLCGDRGEERAVILERYAYIKFLHVRRIGAQLKGLGGSVPGSQSCAAIQDQMQPKYDPADVEAIAVGARQASEQIVGKLETILNLSGCEGESDSTALLAESLLRDERICREQIERFATAIAESQRTNHDVSARLPAATRCV